MLSEVDQALHFLQEMRHKHKFVSQKTGALHQACEQLVAEQVRVCVCVCVCVCEGNVCELCVIIHYVIYMYKLQN